MENIKVPQPLYESLLEAVHDSKFNSVEELSIFILQNYLDHQVKNISSEKEQEIVEERLRNLGYL